jgi:hypothetical protein
MTKDEYKQLYEQVCEQYDILAKELEAIKQAIAAPVQEPVGYITQARCFVHLHECTEAEAKLYGWKALYTTPPAPQRQWVGLTDEEKRNICRVGPVYAPDGVVTRRPLEYRKELEGVALMAMRKAEAKLKEKNHDPM